MVLNLEVRAKLQNDLTKTKIECHFQDPPEIPLHEAVAKNIEGDNFP